MADQELKVGDRVRTPSAPAEGVMEIQGDHGRIVGFETASDGRRVARIEHDPDSPSQPGGDSLVAADLVERID